MQPSSEERRTSAALDDIARSIIDRCQHLADWGGDRPYDMVMKALHRRVLDILQHDSLTNRAWNEGPA
jgi:hypothetical protein